MSVSKRQERNPEPRQEERAVVRWVASRLRWERLLDQVRDERGE